jgi:hypothetical protein
VRKTLYLADDLLNGSFEKRQRLKSTLRRNHPTALRTVEMIVAISSEYNLMDPGQNMTFRRRVITEMRLEGEWSEHDDVKQIKDLILEVEGTTS